MTINLEPEKFIIFAPGREPLLSVQDRGVAQNDPYGGRYRIESLVQVDGGINGVPIYCDDPAVLEAVVPSLLAVMEARQALDAAEQRANQRWRVLREQMDAVIWGRREPEICEEHDDVLYVGQCTHVRPKPADEGHEAQQNEKAST